MKAMERNPSSAKNQTLWDLTLQSIYFAYNEGIISSYSNRTRPCSLHAYLSETVTEHESEMSTAEIITVGFTGWISGRIVSLQPDTDIQKLLSKGNRKRIRISETLL